MRDVIMYCLSKLWVKIVVIAVALVVAVVYCMAFFQFGIETNDSYLIRSRTDTGVEYVGEYYDHALGIEVIDNGGNNFTVKTLLPNGYSEQIQVSVGDYIEYIVEEIDNKETKAMGRKIEFIDENGEILLNKVYYDKMQFYGMIEIYFRPMGAGNIQSAVADYKFNENYIVEAVLGEVTISGNLNYFIVAIVLSILLLIDFCKPLFFYNTNHRYYVVDKKPSENYRKVQEIIWGISALIIIILFIRAI